MRPRVKVWLETDGGEYLLGPGALRLLVATEEHGSLKAGAREVGLSYRAAWDRLKKAEEGLGFALLASRSGGEGGGGSSLTPRAAELVRRYRAFAAGLEALVQRRFEEAFSEGADSE